MKITVVTPTYNEAANIELLVQELVQVLGDRDYEILIVDDDSPDLTWKRAEELGRQFPQVRSLRRHGSKDLSSAVIAGFTEARGEIVACMDADLQHDPRVLPEMIRALDQGADLVIGSRYTKGGSTGDWGWFRGAFSWQATQLAYLFLSLNLKDPMSGFFLLRRSDFLSVWQDLDGTGFKILLEIAARLQPKRVVEIPIRFRRRQYGKSKLSKRVVVQYVRQLWKLSRHTAPVSKKLSKSAIHGFGP